MANYDIQITGIDDVCAALDRLPTELAKAAFAPALKAGGAVLETAIKQGTPIEAGTHISGVSVPPGALRAAVEISVENDAGGRGGQATVDWGDLSYIAGFVDRGHRNVRGGYSHLDKGGRAHGPGRELGDRVPPHPFARRATADCSTDVIATFFTVLDAAMKGMKEF
jgi:HK97 gp10 family phage protein